MKHLLFSLLFTCGIQVFAQNINNDDAQNNYREQSAFISAVLQKDIKEVKRHLEAGADPNGTRNNLTMLQLASSHYFNDSEVVKILIDAGADVNKRDEMYGRTALLEAVFWGKTKIVQILLEAGAEVDNGAKYNGKTTQQLAVERKNDDIVIMLDGAAKAGSKTWREGVDKNVLTRMEKKWELLQVIEQRDIPKIKKLLNKEADVNAALIKAMSEYAEAVSNSYWHEGKYWNISKKELVKFEKETIEIIKILLKAGADVNANQGSALFSAAASGNAKMAKLLLDAGANPNIKEQYGMTPLFIAARGFIEGNTEVVKLLLAAGADVNVKADRSSAGNRTPLMDTVQGRAEIVKLLIDAGADVNAQAEHQNVLAYAAERRNIEILRLLLEAGADVNKKPQKSTDAIVNAISSRGQSSPEFYQYELDYVKLLLDAGTSPDATDISGRTVLFTAARNAKTGVVELLLAAGAKADPIDEDGMTPLMWAIDEYKRYTGVTGHDEVVKLLLAAGANPDLKNKKGYSARDITVEKNFADIITIFDSINNGKETFEQTVTQP